MQLSSLKIIITGGAQGMGAAFARHLHAAGAAVACGDVAEDKLAELPEGVHRRRLDVSSEADCEAFVAWAHERMGGLNALINNAGILRDGLLVRRDKTTGEVKKLGAAEWGAVIGVNLTGATFMVREVVARMAATEQRPGVIVNMSSVARHGNRGQSNYVAAKAALAANTGGRARGLPRVGRRRDAVRRVGAVALAASVLVTPAGAAPPEVDQVAVPGATFRMGSVDRRAEPNEGPTRDVTLTAFTLDRTEVTVGAYRACVERGACGQPVSDSRHCSWLRDDPSLPMNCVTHAEAALFCAARGARLPTEAEWELAARGPRARLYPWGDEPADCARAVSTKGERTADTCGRDGPLPVSTTRGRGPSGAADLAGNVAEWVADFYDHRHPKPSGEPDRDPRGPSAGSSFVVRGGGWLSPRSHLRVTARSWASSVERGSNIGFRCARRP